MLGLSGRRILIAGSARGIGAATARRLAAEGCSLFLGDVNAAGAQIVAQEIEAAGSKVASGYYTLYEESSIRDLVADAVEFLGGLDGLVNVAAETSPEIHDRDLEILKMELDVWEKTNRANVIGTAQVMEYCLPHMFEAGGGSIVNVTSGAAHAGEEIRVAYGASKAGINSITRHVARTYGDRKVRANAVSPGAILTEAGLRVFSAEFQKAAIAAHPLKRLGKPEDVAATIAFLLSDDTEWVTGQVWSVNGGAGFRE